MKLNKITFYYLVLLLLFSLYSLPTKAQQCTQSEVEYLAQNAELLADISQSCAFDCVLSLNQNDCLLACLSEQILVSEGCLSCSVNQINCVLDNCAFACLFPNSQVCEDCISENCLPDFFVCIGDDDIDGYTIEGGDCNNSDDEINPSANDFEGDGIDQNCDGEDGLATALNENYKSKFNVYRNDNFVIITTEIAGILNFYNLHGAVLFSKVINGDEILNIDQFGIIILYSFVGKDIHTSGKI